MTYKQYCDLIEKKRNQKRHGVLIGLIVSSVGAITGLGIGAYFFSPIPLTPKIKVESEIKTFPSYDWGEDEEYYLAAIAATTKGSRADKQQAVIDALDVVWDTHGKIDIKHYFDVNYFFHEEPTDDDYYIIKLTINGIKCSELE